MLETSTDFGLADCAASVRGSPVSVLPGRNRLRDTRSACPGTANVRTGDGHETANPIELHPNRVPIAWRWELSSARGDYRVAVQSNGPSVEPRGHGRQCGYR